LENFEGILAYIVEKFYNQYAKKNYFIAQMKFRKRSTMDNYWLQIWQQLRKHPLGIAGLYVFFLFVIVGLYAPFFASSKPLIVEYNGTWYFPLFRYLFYSEFYTKRLDIFFNLLMFTLPLFIALFLILKNHALGRKILSFAFLAIQIGLFLYFSFKVPVDPSSDRTLTIERQQALQQRKLNDPSWDFDLKYMNDYARLNLVLREVLRKRQDEKLSPYKAAYEAANHQPMPTLWNLERLNEAQDLENLEKNLAGAKEAYKKIEYMKNKKGWLDAQSQNLHGMVMPLLSNFHWEDDAGGNQSLNQIVPWWDLTRINRKDLLSALIFGIRISLSVGIIAVGIALIIGIPIGAFAGYYGGTFDIITSRLLEIWESMPTFFMLLIVVAMMQSKSIFIVITVIGLFGWTTFTRYIRGEFFKQRNLAYVEACRSQGFNNLYIIFSHILPNAIPPVLTLLSFSIMGAITSEAGLSFLGLGEEGSCSWGVLMDEGRAAFPAESYLLWPPAILLTILLVAIALVGDAVRDVIDPRLRSR
jgi:peptide/nickel transport system permease protein